MIQKIVFALAAYAALYTAYVQFKPKQTYIEANPESMAAIKVSDPVRYAKVIEDATSYTASKFRNFSSLSAEERSNYSGGF